MIKNVIFDIGRVLISFEWDSYVRKLFDEETALQVTDAMWNRGVWNELDRGVLPVERVMDIFGCYAPDCREEIKTAFYNVGDACARMPYAIPWIKELKEKGYKVFYLSNYFHYLMDKRPDILDFISYTDGGVFSSDVKLIKPDEEIYRLICEKYSLEPSECLFIDDNIANINGANHFGLTGYLFESYEKDYDKICEILRKDGLD